MQWFHNIQNGTAKAKQANPAATRDWAGLRRFLVILMRALSAWAV